MKKKYSQFASRDSKMFARIPVTLDETKVLTRNSWYCKCCGRKQPAHTPRYQWERYNFCPSCVLTYSDKPSDMIYETSLRVYVPNSYIASVYKNHIDKLKEFCVVPLLAFPQFAPLHKGDYFAVQAHFSDRSWFFIEPYEQFTRADKYPLLYKTKIITEEDASLLGRFSAHFKSMDEGKSEYFPLLQVYRPDLRPFNIEVFVGTPDVAEDNKDS